MPGVRFGPGSIWLGWLTPRTVCLCPWRALDEQIDLPGVMRDLLADTEPEAVIVHVAPPHRALERLEEPGIIPLGELREALFAGITQDVLVEDNTVPPDGGTSGVDLSAGVDLNGAVMSQNTNDTNAFTVVSRTRTRRSSVARWRLRVRDALFGEQWRGLSTRRVRQYGRMSV